MGITHLYYGINNGHNSFILWYLIIFNNGHNSFILWYLIMGITHLYYGIQ